MWVETSLTPIMKGISADMLWLHGALLEAFPYPRLWGKELNWARGTLT